MIFLLDNYDSFTFNLYQYLRELGAEVDVVRNDQTTVADVVARVESGEVDKVVLSPGPCTPAEAGISVPLVGALAGRVPQRGEVIAHPAGFDFEVVDADPRRVKRLRLRKAAAPTTPAAEEPPTT